VAWQLSVLNPLIDSCINLGNHFPRSLIRQMDAVFEVTRVAAETGELVGCEIYDQISI
jgi:hypothetical protein